MGALNLVIVTPQGRLLAEPGVSRVTVRRSEERFESGGQVVFLPGHGSETVHLGHGQLVYVSAQGEQVYVRVDGGFAEIEQGVVTVLTPSASLVAPALA